MNVVAATDLWFPSRRISFGWSGWPQHPDHELPAGADSVRYVVWVNAGRGHGELAPRQALHLAECRNGAGA